MVAKYEEGAFKFYVALQRKSWASMVEAEYRALLDGGEVGDAEANELSSQASLALAMAVAVFSNPATAKPKHLALLNHTLLGMGLTPDEAAQYCLEVEAVRVISGRRLTRPLVDRRPPDDPVQRKARSSLLESTIAPPGCHADDGAPGLYSLLGEYGCVESAWDSPELEQVSGRCFAEENALRLTREQSYEIARLVFGARSLADNFR